MGHRYTITSGDSLEESKLPEWFVEKHGDYMDFSNTFWKSYTEVKMYEGKPYELFHDVYLVCNELDHKPNIQLIMFSDERTMFKSSLEDNPNPDVYWVVINKYGIRKTTLGMI